MSAPELREQVQGIITRISTAQFYLKKVQDEFEEITQELLALDLGGSKSYHVTSANRLWPTIMSELEVVPNDLVLIHSEMIQYRNEL